jgi:hypothetical protein
MSFFEIEPMGTKHYGGIAVGGRLGGKGRGVRKIGMRGMGGMPVGGMPVGGAMMRMKSMGGMPVGGMPVGGMYDAMGGRGTVAGAGKNAWLQYVAMARQTNPTATLKQISASYRQERGQPAAAAVPRMRSGIRRPAGMRATTAPSTRKLSKDVLLEVLMGVLSRLSKAELIEVGDLLTASGFGMMHGGAWYDDLLSGVQTGVQVASQIAPLLAML